MKLLFTFTAAILLIGCASPYTIKPPPVTTKITQVCIVDNPKVLMSGFLPELKSQLHSYGIATQDWTAYNPDGCQYWLYYTANWHWDFTMILIYAELKLYQHTTLIGYAEFNNRKPGANPFHYGAAAGKLKALTGPLFWQPKTE